MVMSYGPNNRNFPGLDRIFPEGKIRRIRGENLVSSPPLSALLKAVIARCIAVPWATAARNTCAFCPNGCSVGLGPNVGTGNGRGISSGPERCGGPRAEARTVRTMLNCSAMKCHASASASLPSAMMVLEYAYKQSGSHRDNYVQPN